MKKILKYLFLLSFVLTQDFIPQNEISIKYTQVFFKWPQLNSSNLYCLYLSSNNETVEYEVNKNSILIIRGCGPIGFPGSAEVVNMQPPDRLLKDGINSLPCIGDGRQSGTSESPSILNVSPEAAIGGGLSIIENYDEIKIDLNNKRVDLLLEDKIIKYE